MANQRKIEQVNQLSEKIENTSGLIFLNYQGLKHNDLEDLRNEVEKLGGTLHISKNSLLTIALRNTKHSKISAEVAKYTDPTATLYLGEDYVSALKTLSEFVKAHELPVIKGGIIEDQVLAQNEVNRVANLPAKEVLYSQLLGQFNAPITNLVYVLNGNIRQLVYALSAIRDSKGGE